MKLDDQLITFGYHLFDVIPQDPTRTEFRQGTTLGPNHKHWFRAKFFQQYRLFYRYHVQAKVIVYAWVNDSNVISPGAKVNQGDWLIDSGIAPK